MRKSPRQKVRENQFKRCEAKGCTRSRNGFSACCSYHNRKKWEYGWVEGRRVYPKDYEYEKEKVRSLVDTNLDHPGIKAGIGFFENWIRSAINGHRVLGAPHFQRLGEEGITGKEVMIECAGLWIYATENPRAIPDGNPLTYALSICVLTKSNNTRGCKTSGNIKADLRRNVGTYIRENIGVLFITIERAVQQRELNRNQARAAMSQPISG